MPACSTTALREACLMPGFSGGEERASGRTRAHAAYPVGRYDQAARAASTSSL